MNRIEEIKSYDDSYWQRYLRENTIFDVDNIKAQKDWLISRLEIAEKALERMSTGNFSAPMEYSQIEAYQKYAESALDRIRS